ncbi:hypothetical protein [Ruegeria sp. SCP11]|uniref:hypothetical protein n=1 Tax=Ruegeria sp. SCP11 TaxID=3141378 RepID=UPI00333B00AE
MRASHVVLLAAISAASASAGELAWPDANIPVPSKSETFILSECTKYKGSTEENVEECINGERYGYRAVVMMLTDEAAGERAAERYRACRAGLGDNGGRFHRRRAECIGRSLGIIWRFEVTQKASLRSHPTLSASVWNYLTPLVPPARQHD